MIILEHINRCGFTKCSLSWFCWPGTFLGRIDSACSKRITSQVILSSFAQQKFTPLWSKKSTRFCYKNAMIFSFCIFHLLIASVSSIKCEISFSSDPPRGVRYVATWFKAWMQEECPEKPPKYCIACIVKGVLMTYDNGTEQLFGTVWACSCDPGKCIILCKLGYLNYF